MWKRRCLFSPPKPLLGPMVEREKNTMPPSEDCTCEVGQSTTCPEHGRKIWAANENTLWLAKPLMNEILNCPCGFRGASRLVAAHRVTCSAWIDKIKSGMGVPEPVPFCGKCGFVHAASGACPNDLNESQSDFDPRVKPTTMFGGENVPSPFSHRPTTSAKPKDKKDFDKPKKRKH